jgi:murein DD-endopeptidase MepM/ murein hydrolase activator NlpD
VSPLLHDYKSSSHARPKKLRPWQWFACGLGLPLLIVIGALATGGAESSDATLVTEMPTVPDVTAGDSTALLALAEIEKPEAATEEAAESLPAGPAATAAEEPASAQLDAAAETSAANVDTEFHPPLVLPPAPSYDLVTHTIRSGDTLEKLFRKEKISLQDLARIVQLPEASDYLAKLRPGDTFEIKHDNGKLISLYRELNLVRALEISRHDDRFAATLIDRPIDVRRNHAYGRIETSLFESAAAAGLPDKLIMNLAGIFAWDVDFVLDIRSGDDYYILYEEIWQDGKFVTTGEIIAAEFNNAGRTNHAIRFVDRDGRSDYFTPEGRSVRKAFVRAPVDFTRISSNFNPRRKHPVLNTIRAHKGVDYAAPKGTPIKAAGDGKVIFRGRKGGYGNAIILQHGGNITTLYAHMTSFAKNAQNGRRVKQGQTIGYVGSTGLATAAHLHYEYRVNGVHRNPRTVALPQADPIRAEYRDEFIASAQPILDELNRYKRTQIASYSSE